MSEDTTNLGRIIQIDDERVREYLRNVVRGGVEETLNAMLEAEAERLCNAGRYERTEARRDTRAGSYRRKLGTQAGVRASPDRQLDNSVTDFEPNIRLRH